MIWCLVAGLCRRKNPGGSIELGLVPDHLRSHDEVVTLALEDAMRRMYYDEPSQAERLSAALAAQEADLKRIHARPMKGLFGHRIDHRGQAARVSGAEQKLAYLREVLEGKVKYAAAIRSAARLERLELEESGALDDCECVACAQDFDPRAEAYAMERAEKRGETFRARFRPSHSTTRYRRGRY
jgi:hypothetical protein